MVWDLVRKVHSVPHRNGLRHSKSETATSIVPGRPLSELKTSVGGRPPRRDNPPSAILKRAGHLRPIPHQGLVSCSQAGSEADDDLSGPVFCLRGTLHQRDQTPAMPLQATGELKLQQHDPHNGGRRL
jgi:hypothetical protein